MRMLSVGGGPAGLYFALLMKKSDPGAHITVVERNRADDTFGFGVVFSDATLGNLAAADPESHAEITRAFAHWGDIDIFRPGGAGGQGGVIRSAGHGFAGMGRRRLNDILQRRCAELGVELVFQTELPPDDSFGGAELVLCADGVNSALRAHYADAFRPEVDLRPNRFVWLGTSFPFEAFTFYFKADAAGLWRVHAYRYAEGESTFIVECTEATWRSAGMDRSDEAGTVAYCERLFADELRGHPLLTNRSLWRQFPIIRNGRWSTLRHGAGGGQHLVLLGDAAHTAHFSIGSGTKLAIEDAIALHAAVTGASTLAEGVARYEAARRPVVESTQRAAQVSLEWFESTERYMHLPPLQFAASLLTRSLRVTHENLKLRDPQFVADADRWYAGEAERQVGNAGDDSRNCRSVPVPASDPGGTVPAPMFTPFRLRQLVLRNRVVVSPMCQYSADDGTIDDWHLVHLGSRALGGAGLLMCEMTAVSSEARITHGCAGLYRDQHTAAWQRVVEFAHRFGEGAVGIQLGHAGRKGATCIPWQGGDNAPLPDGPDGKAWPILAASPLAWSPAHATPRAMDRADMTRTVADYVAATRRADEAGFDLIEIHAAHGYLLASFLSPLTNRRDDEYGGPVESRLRFPLEVVTAVRAAWPAHKPISVRLSATDWAPGGLSPVDLLAIARALQSAGVDLLDISTGQTVPEERPRFGRLFQTPLADLVRNEVGIPTLTVGAVSTWEDVNSILLAGRADLVALARGHLYDPYFTRHAAFEQKQPMPWPDPYRSLARYAPQPTKR